MNITIDDCIGMCGLTKDEVDAIAEHERLPEIVAAELGCYLVRDSAGRTRIRRMIEDDIAAATAKGRHRHAAVLKLALCHFLSEHEADERPAFGSGEPESTSGG
ncbi:hypothetical protein J2847_001255 [Azospirillum agricola]|uniref:hypothetical protein n=1 Tax=Azospirillum agricola TaxID=1720247 RepID=UPI001AE33D9D|nr:hypothetical protein [Azospirillum agricola]MBP2227973.1 hypothetical protein [Azospirillum agricola]